MMDRNNQLLKNVISLKWVSAVTKGGKRQRVAAEVVVGDGKGKFGVSLSKAKEASSAVKKAMDKASRFMINIPMKKGATLHHDISVKYGATRVMLRSAPSGTGIVASETVRLILEVIGFQDIVAKVIGSKNPHNVYKALLKGLLLIKSPRYISNVRGLNIYEVLGLKNKKHKLVTPGITSKQVETNSTLEETI